MTGVPPPGYPDQSLPQSKGGDIVALFLPLKGEPRGLSLCAGAEADWNVCRAASFVAGQGRE